MNMPVKVRGRSVPSLLADSKHITNGLEPTGVGQRVINVSRIIRRMRGSSQSHLVQCVNGWYCVVKCLGNPQGNRSLINEFVSHRLMKMLPITLPDLCLLQLTEATVGTENLYFQQGNRLTRPEGNLHLGSRCPCNPETKAIFDFLPSAYLEKVSNIDEFAIVFVLDKWLNNKDKRQSIFFRNPQNARQHFLKAVFIDHGMTLGGTAWTWEDWPLHGLAFPRTIYSMIDMDRLTQVAIELVTAIPSEMISAAADDLPSTWLLLQDRTRLAAHLAAVDRRRETLRSLIRQHLRAVAV